MEFGSSLVYAAKDGSKAEYEHIPESRYNHTVKAYSSGASGSYDPNDDGETCLLDILDTAGQEEYSAMRDTYVQAGDCFLLVYSITDRQTFEEVKAMHQWINRLRDQDMPMVVVGNKCDLDAQRAVSQAEGAAYAQSIGAPFFEASAKLNLNVTEAMQELIRHTPRLHGKEYKVVIQGSGGVGKSSICNQYVCGHFIEDYDPTIEDSYRKQVVIPGLPKPKSKKKEGKKGGASASAGGHGKRRSFLGSLFHRSKETTPTLDTPTPAAAAPPPKPEEEKTVKVKRNNSNALVLQLGSLAKEPTLTTGDPCFCKQCGAAVSHISQLTSQAETISWKCEFCGEENHGIELSPDAVPSDSVADYLLEPAEPEPSSEEDDEKGKENAGPDNDKERKKGDDGKGRSQRSNLVIFAMDISGSMSTTVEVPALQAEWSSVTGRGGGGARYISRLEAIKEAVCRHLDHMSVTEPHNKVALVVFDNKVQYYGDGAAGSNQLNSGSLDDYNVLMKQGQVFGSDLSLREIQDSLNDIKARVKGLSTGGTTALGPALALCVGMASNFPSGEIILCTDGVSNVGVGNLEGGRSDSSFYTTMGEHAQVSHTTISVLGIEGSTCAMEALSACAAVTHGTVNILHPLEMVRQIRLIAQNPTIATDVEVTYLLHPAISIDKKSESKYITMAREQLGNATRESDVSITFTVDAAKLKNLNALPFQVQIRYSRKDGSKWLRVISQSRQVTREREEMERASNVAVMGLAAVQRSAQLAQAGKIQESREVLHAVEHMVERGAKTDQQQEEHAIFREAANHLDQALMSQTSRKGSGLSDSTAKALHGNRNAHMAQFLSGAAKRALVEQRKAGEAVQQQYYNYKFQ